MTEANLYSLQICVGTAAIVWVGVKLLRYLARERERQTAKTEAIASAVHRRLQPTGMMVFHGGLGRDSETIRVRAWTRDSEGRNGTPDWLLEVDVSPHALRIGIFQKDLHAPLYRSLTVMKDDPEAMADVITQHLLEVAGLIGLQTGTPHPLGALARIDGLPS